MTATTTARMTRAMGARVRAAGPPSGTTRCSASPRRTSTRRTATCSRRASPRPSRSPKPTARAPRRPPPRHSAIGHRSSRRPRLLSARPHPTPSRPRARPAVQAGVPVPPVARTAAARSGRGRCKHGQARHRSNGARARAHHREAPVKAHHRGGQWGEAPHPVLMMTMTARMTTTMTARTAVMTVRTMMIMTTRRHAGLCPAPPAARAVWRGPGAAGPRRKPLPLHHLGLKRGPSSLLDLLEASRR